MFNVFLDTRYYIKLTSGHNIIVNKLQPFNRRFVEMRFT